MFTITTEENTFLSSSQNNRFNASKADFEVIN